MEERPSLRIEIPIRELYERWLEETSFDKENPQHQSIVIDIGGGGKESDRDENGFITIQM